MPIYEYRCSTCDSDFEHLTRSYEEPSCPQCGTREVEKQLSVPAAHTSGSRSLPICEGPSPSPCGRGGCGLPECG